jgi:tyrosine-protein kinase Etk/Wzc
LLFLGPLYEQAKITEAKEIPNFEVLDYAHRPDRKAKPKRVIIVIAAFMFALLSSGVYVLLKETQ